MKGSSVVLIQIVIDVYARKKDAYLGVQCYIKLKTESTILRTIVFGGLTIFNEGAYLTFKSIFHMTLNLF